MLWEGQGDAVTTTDKRVQGLVQWEFKIQLLLYKLLNKGTEEDPAGPRRGGTSAGIACGI